MTAGSTTSALPATMLASVPNLRDLGGLPTIDGRHVAKGRVFRSSHLHALTPEDEAAFAALGIRSVVDLRGVRERDAALSRGLHPDTAELHLPIEPRGLGALREMRQAGNVDEDAVVDLMHNAYRRFVLQHPPVFAALLRRLQEPGATPLLFHCTAGKDRTGMGAVLILLALGVPQDAIVEDFLLSNGRWQPREATRDWTVLSRVRAEYLETAFDTMIAQSGSIDTYLRDALGLDAEARDRLVANLVI